MAKNVRLGLVLIIVGMLILVVNTARAQDPTAEPTESSEIKYDWQSYSGMYALTVSSDMYLIMHFLNDNVSVPIYSMNASMGELVTAYAENGKLIVLFQFGTLTGKIISEIGLYGLENPNFDERANAEIDEAALCVLRVLMSTIQPHEVKFSLESYDGTEADGSCIIDFPDDLKETYEALAKLFELELAE